MNRERMWKLSTEKYVEEELFNLGQKLNFEQLVFICMFLCCCYETRILLNYSFYFLPSAIHSFILDVDDNVIREHFSKEEREEIKFASSPQVPEMSDEIDEFLIKFIDKVINNLHTIDKI